MADQKEKKDQFLAPPILAAIKNEDVAARVRMERSVSQEIREERADLKEAAEHSLNVIVDLGLDGRVRWVSPSWRDVVGTPPESVEGKPIAEVILLDGETNPFMEAMESLQQDDSKSHIIRFRLKLGPASEFKKDSTILAAQREAEGFRQDEFEDEEEGSIITLEGQGIMVLDRTSGGESHTMWMLRPATVPREITIDLPDVLVESLGFGAEVLANHLTALAETGSEDPATLPPPMPILCRICERQIVSWWFEKHSELCLQEHKAESEVQQAHEALADHRSQIVKVLDTLEARKARPTSSEPSPSPIPPPEYKGLPIGPAISSASSSSTSGRNSPATPPRSRETSTGLGHSRARSFAVRRPLGRIVELILDLCDTALEIKTPALSGQGADGEFRTQSPVSESRVSQVLSWQTPGSNTLDTEEGLAALTTDTESLAKDKVEATLRFRRILEYSERIRIEFHVLVQDCIEAAMRKAQSIREGRLSDSSETESDEETPAPSTTTFSGSQTQPTSLSQSQNLSLSQGRASPGTSAMAMALQNVSETTFDPTERRRSVAISTGSNSPMECPTPRSHSRTAGILGRNHSVSKRASLYGGSDAGDSDGSLSSSVLSQGKRTESPGQEVQLGRSQSSRDRKRRSLKLSAGVSGMSASPRRRESPPRGMQPPASPLRLSKPRIPSGNDLGGHSPISSPMLASLDPGSPIDHRRHPSTADPNRAPPSPRLAAINQPQQRAVPPSIKDFEIIKPISKGAFGSVYLSKKKTTGDYFAIKVLKKSDMVAKNQVTNVKAERAIMMWQGESDFVAKLYWTFSSKDYLYLVMEYLNGGDCASLIKVLGGLPEDWAKKYLAEVVLGVEHLHNRNIVHRDLKPDNLLIDAKGHLKLTDFGLSRMGLIGRQKRLAKSPHNSVPDLLKSGPFVRPRSITSSRSTSFDFQGQQSQSPTATPVMTPDMAGPNGQPSYFSLGREIVLSREHSRRQSGYRSDSGSSDTFNAMFKNFSLEDSTHRGPPIEEEQVGGEGADSPDPYVLQPSTSQSQTGHIGTPPQTSMPPPALALFDPEDQNRRFVGTPDYLAPETINGFGQDESSDWWSIGCILFEFLYGFPPFHAETPEGVFENILARRIEWPSEDECEVSREAHDLMERLMTTNTKERLGSNVAEKYQSGGREVRDHPWFEGMNWETLLEDEAQFVPAPQNPEDTEYFDARGATLQAFAEELEDQASSPAPTPGADYPDRPHDALSGLRRQFNSMKRNLMPLHIPAHVRETRSRRLSEPVATDDFGAFAFKNLPVLEKANKDVIQKLRQEALKESQKPAGQQSSQSSASQAGSVEGSPLLPSPLKRTLSAHKNSNRATSPSQSSLGPAQVSASPNRISHPTSPLLVQFSTGQNHERRKTSSTSSASHNSNSSLQPGNFFDPPKLSSSLSAGASLTSSPVKAGKPTPASQIVSPDRGLNPPPRPLSVASSRNRSQTVGSQEDNPMSAGPYTHHHKRRSQVFDVSPSSSDNEDTRAKVLLRVQRRRQSSRRMSQFSINEGPCFRPLDVLICEDHPVSRLVMEKLLEKLRCRTITVLNGPDAVRFATSEVQFDIIMMEVKLPQLSGSDVARMIRSTKNANQTTPIIAVTGYLKELPQAHHFDALIDKPPTIEKLTEVLCTLCQWKPPPPDWHPGPLQHIPSSLRQESNATEDSPSSQSSGPFAQVPGSSYRASSREDSIGSSSFFGDMDASDAGGGVIISQGDDWMTHGLGITEDIGDNKSFTHPGLPHLLHYNSAPPILDVTMPSPRKAPSQEAIRAKKEAHEKNRHECAESGDDEDEELGDVMVQPKSPRRKTRGAGTGSGSKLGSSMLRTNSSGSVISGSDDILPKEAMATHAGNMNIGDMHGLGDIGDGGAGDLTESIESISLNENMSITPPEVFSKYGVGGESKEIDMDATPRPSVSAGGSHAHPEMGPPVTPTGKRMGLGESPSPSRSEEATPRGIVPNR